MLAIIAFRLLPRFENLVHRRLVWLLVF